MILLDLSRAQIPVLGLFTTVISAVALLLLVSNLASKTRLIQKSIFSFFCLTVLFFTFACAQACASLTEDCALGAFEWAGRMPVWLLCVVVALALNCEIALAAWTILQKRNSLGPNVISEALDKLPDGVCFSDESGEVLLTNEKMADLIHAASDTTPLVNIPEVLNRIVEGRVLGVQPVSFHPLTVLKVEDSTVWNITTRHVTSEEKEFNETKAEYVTESFRLASELLARTKRLKDLENERRSAQHQCDEMTWKSSRLFIQLRGGTDASQALQAARSAFTSPSRTALEEVKEKWQHIAPDT